MARAGSANGNQAREDRHRVKRTAEGSKRVEVTVPARDARLVKAIAGALRSGGEDARRIRDSLQPMFSAPKANTGPELVAFFRASPLAGADLQVERDRSTGRDADLN